MKFLLILFTFFISSNAQHFYKKPLVHTYSILAVDSISGDIGAAVQSHWFSVGSIVLWAESDVGAVATQSFVNVSLGPKGLALMKSGSSPKEALELLISEDEGRDFRQVALIDAQGNSAAYTGIKCIAAAGHTYDKYYSIQANLMLNESVWPAMERVFLETRAPLAERLIAALEAAEGVGGDIRGKQSAAILVVKGKSSGKPWEDKLVDLRIEDHPEPVKELKRLLAIHRAYEHMNAGDLAIEKGDEKTALNEYGSAQKMQPENLEMKYWSGISMINIGKFQEALPLLREVFQKEKKWKILTPRLIPNGLLQTDAEGLKKIMSLD